MGELSEDHTHKVSLVARRRVQIRHNALEAARIAANRFLQEKLGKNFFLRILLLPHVILRENKMIFGAHADRLQDGMRKAFGKPIGRAARVEPDQPIAEVYVNKDNVEVAKEALRRAGAKLPTPYRIVIEELEKPSLEVKTVVS